MPNEKTSRFLFQGGVWIILIVLPVMFIMNQPWPGMGLFFFLKSWHFWSFVTVYLAIFYLNQQVLIPFLLFRKRAGLYMLSVIVILISLHFLKPFDKLNLMFDPRTYIEQKMPPMPYPRPRPAEQVMHRPQIDIIGIFLGIVAIAAGLVAAMQRKWQNTAMRLAHAETEKLNAELAFLKARVRPHFLFNTLNNIYVLAEQKSDRAGESILRLSAIMRYVTDDVGAEKVPLQSEINCLEDLIALQQLRLNDKTTIEYTCNGTFDGHAIAPLVLMPFVENAFKYGVSNHVPSVIAIKIDIDEQSINFYCRNKIVNKPKDNSRTGTGLEDVQKRLDYLYGSRYQLTINNTDDHFEVKLVLHEK